MDKILTTEIQTILEDRLKQDYEKFRVQGVMIGWLSAFQTIDEHIKTLRYKKDITAYLEAEIKRIKEVMNLPPESVNDNDS